MTPWDRLRAWQTEVREPALSLLVVYLLFLEFVLAPWEVEAGLDVRRGGSGVIAAGFAGFAFCIVRTRLGVALVLGVCLMAILGWILGGFMPPSAEIRIELIVKFAVLVLLTGAIGAAVFGPGAITLHRVLGAVAIYLMVALIFAQAFGAIVSLDPHAYQFAPGNHPGDGQLLYFSFATLTTAGYGDIVPVDPFARSLASLEAVFGQLYPATVLARLLTLELEARRR